MNITNSKEIAAWRSIAAISQDRMIELKHMTPDSDAHAKEHLEDARRHFANAAYHLKQLPNAKNTFSFSDALEHIKRGLAVTRTGWNGKGMWIMLRSPNTKSEMTLPYIYMKTVDHNLVPWLASQTDLLAEDWQIAEVTNPL